MPHGDLNHINRQSHNQHTVTEITDLLRISGESIRHWLKNYLVKGIGGLNSGKSPGRLPKLTKKQRRALARMIEKWPEACGFVGSCWRTPMIQHLIQEKYGVFYNARYISELLKN